MITLSQSLEIFHFFLKYTLSTGLFILTAACGEQKYDLWQIIFNFNITKEQSKLVGIMARHSTSHSSADHHYSALQVSEHESYKESFAAKSDAICESSSKENTEQNGGENLQTISSHRLHHASGEDFTMASRENIVNCPTDIPVDEGKLLENNVNDPNVKIDDTSICNENQVFTLDTIPIEILLHICTFLEAGEIIGIMSKVCKTFQELFTDESYWRIRITKRWPKKYPPVSCQNIDWQGACIDRERSHRVWSHPEQHLEHFTFNEGLFAAIDVVHLLQEGHLLAAGSRDRYLTLLDLRKYDISRPETKKDMKLHCINKAHNGWIWSMASLGTQLFTGSWDTAIKVWDLEQGQAVTAHKCKSAVLGLYAEANFLVGGCFDKKVYFFDPRRESPVKIKRWHRQPVLCVTGDDRYIVTGSEDKSFSVYDRRAEAVFKSVHVESYPLDMSYHCNQLWYGDKHGFLNLIDATLGNFELVQRYNVGHTDKVTGVVHTAGAIYTSSNDKTIKVLEPSVDPKAIVTLQKHDSGVARIDFKNGVLASAGCDISVGIWRPKCDWGWQCF